MSDQKEMEEVLTPYHQVAFKQSSTKRWLIAAMVILGVVAAVLIFVLVVALGVVAASKDEGEDVCLTDSCVELASNVRSGLDTSVDPCVDFYNFTCGNWVKNNIIPQGYGQYGSFNTLDSLNKQGLAELLAQRNEDDIDAIVKAKDFYQSCLNTDSTNSAGTGPMMEVIQKTGGWALIGNDDGTPWDLNGNEFLLEKQYGSDAFFTLSVYLDAMDPREFITYVYNSGLTLPSPIQYEDPEYISILRDLMVSIMTALNPDGDNVTYTNAANDIIELETNLSMVVCLFVLGSNGNGGYIHHTQIYQEVDFFEDGFYNKYTLGDLDSSSTLWPEFNWLAYSQMLFARAGVSDIDTTEPIIVITPSYFEELSAVYNSADPITLENYAKWHLVLPLVDLLDDDCVAAYNDFKQATTGNVEFSERTQFCVEQTETMLPVSIARIYAESILPSGSKEPAAAMVTGVMAAFRERIATRNWLDEPTKERAKKKVDLMDQMVAYPDLVFNDDWLNGLYSDYDISTESLFDNALGVQFNMLLGMLAQLRKPVDLWTINPPQVMPTDVNAFYHPLLNLMFILEGIMGVPFFQPGWPDYFMYGGLGAVIGHEITHGFDSNGRLFNETGQMQEWWTTSSVTNFVERQQCFVDQYSQYSLFGINANGTTTLGENIADNGGIAAAYVAYKNVKGTPQTLPSLDYTPEQLYFIAFGQLWCSYYTADGYRMQVLFDEHSPQPSRVIGTLMNSPEFAEAFQCPEGSPMNPKNKCSLW